MCVMCPSFHFNIASDEYKWTINRMTAPEEKNGAKQMSSNSKREQEPIDAHAFQCLYA